ncbi:MAG: family 1 glycosylhydrolase [Caldilineaceae bacterium]
MYARVSTDCSVASAECSARLYVTENGASYSDGPDADGRIHDERRRVYLRDHFAAVHRAMAAGVPVAGSSSGRSWTTSSGPRATPQRFGLVWVDYVTQQRIPKESARWYRTVIERSLAWSTTNSRKQRHG